MDPGVQDFSMFLNEPFPSREHLHDYSFELVQLEMPVSDGGKEK